MAIKIIQKGLFILFNIGFAIAIFSFFAWLDTQQKEANTTNKEYSVGEVIPFDDTEVIVTSIHVTPRVAPPEIKDPLLEFGGYRAPENCQVFKVARTILDCHDRNSMRELLISYLGKYDRDRLTVNYTVKSTQRGTPAVNTVTATIETPMKRDMKEPVQIIEGVTVIPYGTSDPVVKDGGKEIEHQLWTDLKNDGGLYDKGEDTATLTFTCKNATRKVPIAVTELAEKNS